MGLSPELREWMHKSVGEYKSSNKAATMQEHLERSAGLVLVAAGNRPIDDDQFQGCMAHLCYAATKFDPNRGVEWSTFAVNCAKRWFIKEWRAAQNRVNTVNDVKSKIDCEIADVTEFIPSSLPGPDDSTQLKDAIAAMLKAVDDLPQREREILYARYGLRGGSWSTLGDVGKMYGIGKERTRQIEAKTLDMLRLKLSKVMNKGR